MTPLRLAEAGSAQNATSTSAGSPGSFLKGLFPGGGPFPGEVSIARVWGGEGEGRQRTDHKDR